MSITYYVALPFVRTEEGIAAGQAQEMPNDRSAIIKAEAMSRAPRWAALFMLNQNLHAVHHDRPDLPWHALPAAFGPSGRYTDRYLLLMLKQFLGPRRHGTAG